MNTRTLISTVTASLLLLSVSLFSQTKQDSQSDHLVVIWTSDDPYLAERVAFMYTHAAKRSGWFDDVTLVIWGPSAKLAAENIIVQKKLGEMKEDGVVIEACIVCAKEYGVTDKLGELGFNVKPMGKPLTDFLKNGSKVLTF